ncbi:hypothetical protein JOM56_012438 [Amanita muscaria]
MPSKPARRPPLPKGALCATLFSRGGDVYHWSFIYPINSEDAIKFHAVTGAESWLYQRDEHFVARSRYACVVVQLNEPGTCTAEDVDRILHDIPLVTAGGEDETFTCRVWMRAAVTKLHEARVINCSDPKRLEDELRQLARTNNQATLDGLGYTLHKSHICP